MLDRINVSSCIPVRSTIFTISGLAQRLGSGVEASDRLIFPRLAGLRRP